MSEGRKATGGSLGGPERPAMPDKLGAMAAPLTYFVYVDEAERWHWVLSDASGRSLAVSSQDYASESECRLGIAAVMRSSSAPVLRS